MNLLRRPYASGLVSGFGSADCLLGERTVQLGRGVEHGRLLSWNEDGRDREFVLLPYPKSGTSISPAIHSFPKRPRSGSEPKDEDEEFAHRSLARMNSVIARIQELEAALDDTESVWERLSGAWDRAATIANPRMAEIVRQARDILPHLQVLERRMRRVLRRVRELTPLNQVQEMDRASMLWLVRQPGRTTEERAGADQRVLAIVREENFDTLKNRVLHSYLVLAADVAREWLRENSSSASSQRYGVVDKYSAFCRRCAFRRIRSAFPTTSGQSFRGIRSPEDHCRVGMVLDVRLGGLRQLFRWGRSSAALNGRRVRGDRCCGPVGPGWHRQRWVRR